MPGLFIVSIDWLNYTLLIKTFEWLWRELIFIGGKGDFHMGGTHFGRGEGIDPEGNPDVMLITQV